MGARQPILDPRKAPVQLNVNVPWEFREHLMTISRQRKQSLTRTVVSALKAAYPPDAPKPEPKPSAPDTKIADAQSELAAMIAEAGFLEEE